MSALKFHRRHNRVLGAAAILGGLAAAPAAATSLSEAVNISTSQIDAGGGSPLSRAQAATVSQVEPESAIHDDSLRTARAWAAAFLPQAGGEGRGNSARTVQISGEGAASWDPGPDLAAEIRRLASVDLGSNTSPGNVSMQEQTGEANRALTVQLGTGNNSVQVQSGSELTAITFQQGEGNLSQIYQSGIGNEAMVAQTGFFNFASIEQGGRGSLAFISQSGTGNRAFIRQ